MRQIAQDTPERMIRAYLIIAISDDQHGMGPIDSTAEKLQQVERRFIRPVNVFSDRYRRRANFL